MDSAAPALDERPAARFGTDAHKAKPMQASPTRLAWVRRSRRERAAHGQGALARGVESEPRRRAAPYLRHRTNRTARVARQTTATKSDARSSVKERERARLCDPFRELDRADHDKDDGATDGDDDKLEPLRLRQSAPVAHGSRDRPQTGSGKARRRLRAAARGARPWVEGNGHLARIESREGFGHAPPQPTGETYQP